MHRFWWAASMTTVAFTSVACSSDGDAGDEQIATGGSGGDGGSSGAGGAGASGGSGGSSAGSGGASGTGGNGGSVATGGAGGTGASGGSSGSGASGGSSSVPGATVVCGTTTCNLSDQMCCDYHNTDPGCFPRGTYCFPGVDVNCDGPEDCAGEQVCCAKVVIHAQTREYLSMQCQATCAASDERVVCGTAGTCPTGTSCAESDIAPPYRDCT